MQLATLLLRAATLGPPLAAAYSIAKRQVSADASLSSCSQNGNVLPLAGASLFFDSVNIFNACYAAHVTHLDVAGIDYDAKVQGEGSDCQGRRVGSITLPPDMSGRLRVDWLCSDDKLRPCTVYSVLNPFPLQTPPSGSKVVIDQACLAEDAVGLNASKTAASAVDSVVASTLGSSSLESSSLGWSTLGSFSQGMPDRTAMGPPATSRSALDVGAPSSTFAVAAAESLAGSSAFAVSSSRPQFTSQLTSQLTSPLMAQDTPTASTMTAPVAATDALADGEGHSSAALPTKSAEGCGLPHAGSSVSAQDAPSRQCACS